MNWYYILDGQQYGPVQQTELCDLARKGIIQPMTYVWREGMADWVRWQAIDSQLMPTPGQYPLPPLAAQAAAQNWQGSGGQTPNSELRARARNSLEGNWWLAAGFTFLFYLVSTSLAFLMLFVVMLFPIPIISNLVQNLFTGPLNLGRTSFYMSLSRNWAAQLEQLFDGFKLFGSGFLIWFLSALYVGILTSIAAIPLVFVAVLLIGAHISQFYDPEAFDPDMLTTRTAILLVLTLIPPIVVAIFTGLQISQAYFIKLDRPELGALESLQRSATLMRGNKWKAFCLGLSFIGWIILTILTFGLGLLLLEPYMRTTYAHFYNDLLEPRRNL